MKIILIPLEHDGRELRLEKILPQVVDNNIPIYWESIGRSNSGARHRRGLEDSKLIALFELTLFIIVDQDYRLHRDIYEGTGIKDGRYSNVKISQLASNAAKGSQAVINLRESNLKGLTVKFNIDELVINRNNNKYLREYNIKLNKLFDQLISRLSQDRNYNFVDFFYITSKLDRIRTTDNFSESRYNGLELKEYLKSVRDVSDCLYLINESKNSELLFCCIGNVHIEGLRRCLTSHDVDVIVLELLELFDNFDSDKIIKEKISDELKRIKVQRER